MNQIIDKNSKMTQSMNRKGNCWDNAMAESLYGYRFNSYQQLYLYDCISDYIQWYNTKSLHSSSGYKTPSQRELELRGFFKIAA